MQRIEEHILNQSSGIFDVGRVSGTHLSVDAHHSLGPVPYQRLTLHGYGYEPIFRRIVTFGV